MLDHDVANGFNVRGESQQKISGPGLPLAARERLEMRVCFLQNIGGRTVADSREIELLKVPGRAFHNGNDDHSQAKAGNQPSRTQGRLSENHRTQDVLERPGPKCGRGNADSASHISNSDLAAVRPDVRAEDPKQSPDALPCRSLVMRHDVKKMFCSNN